MKRLYLLFLIVILSSLTVSAVFSEEASTSESPDVSGTLFEHVLDGNTLELFPFVPEITLPHGITMHRLMLVLSVLLITGFYSAWIKRGDLKPKTRTILLESLVIFVRDDIVYPIMGEERGAKWLPFFTTMFLFLSVLNLLGLIPALKTATGNINVTTAMAIVVLLLTFIAGFKGLGFVHFFKNLFPEGTPLGIGIFVMLLELLSLFTKSMVLSLRLFANMFAGHLAILSFLVLIFVITPFFGFISVPFSVFTYTLEVLVGLLQAFVFTLLSCIFIMMASTPEGE
ncbi:MAG: ATP synthase F0 subunit A [Spirochaetes bacterium]|nr:MAG: ATP synthase F0 subunit A [Spirochaetota bacterium]